MFDHAARRGRLSERMRAEGVDLLFLDLSSDLEYLAGVERGIPFFGQSSYPHGWVAGGFFRPDADPVLVLPRMVAVFDLPVAPEGEVVVVDETDDGPAVFERVAKSLGARGVIAVGDRVWAETTLELARIFGVDRLRAGLLAARAVRRVVGNDGAGAARARLAGARGAGIRRARRAVPRARADGRRGARSGRARPRRVPGRGREVDRRVGRGSGRRRRGRAQANPAGRRARGRRRRRRVEFRAGAPRRARGSAGRRRSDGGHRPRERPTPGGSRWGGSATSRPLDDGPAIRRTQRPSRGVPPARASSCGT